MKRKYLSESHGKLDVVILGSWMTRNYGGVLTGYALYRTVRSLGYDAVLVDHLGWYGSGLSGDTVLDFIDSHKIRVVAGWSAAAQRRLAASAHTILVGSDQLWNPETVNNLFFFLDWAGAANRKISYATSLGKNNKERFLDEYLEKYRKYLRRFDAISVREAQSVPFMKELFGVQACWQLDPVFLLYAEEWRKLAEKENDRLPERYLLAYILDPTQEKCGISIELARQQKLTDVIFVFDIKAKTPPMDIPAGVNVYVMHPKIPLWLRLYANASRVVTDSFHGSCFSLIFERQFISIGNASRGIDRFVSLMQQFGLKNHLMSWSKELEWPSEELDYASITPRMEKLREESLAWLKTQLASQKRSEELEMLNREVEQTLPPERPFISEMKRYFYARHPKPFLFARRQKNKIIKLWNSFFV